MALLLALRLAPAIADQNDEAGDLTEADRLNDIWSMAEAAIIVERCPYAKINPQIQAEILKRAHIDLSQGSEDSKLFAFRLDERRDYFWARSEHEMCLKGAIGYGPHGIGATNLLIFETPYKE